MDYIFSRKNSQKDEQVRLKSFLFREFCEILGFAKVSEQVFPPAGKEKIGQRRFRKHLLRDQNDFNRHDDHIHWNPDKHGWAKSTSDQAHTSFYRYVAQGIYPGNWENHAGYDIEGVQ